MFQGNSRINRTCSKFTVNVVINLVKYKVVISFHQVSLEEFMNEEFTNDFEEFCHLQILHCWFERGFAQIVLPLLCLLLPFALFCSCLNFECLQVFFLFCHGPKFVKNWQPSGTDLLIRLHTTNSFEPSSF